MENYEIAFWKYVAVSVAVFSKIRWKTTKLFFESLLLFLVKSYGKLRNCFLKVCWLCFCVSVAVFSKIIWKNTQLLFESLLVMFLCFCCCFACCFCFCCCSEAVSQYSRSASVLRKFLDACAAYFKEVFECSRSASGLMQILNARAAHVFWKPVS